MKFLFLILILSGCASYKGNQKFKTEGFYYTADKHIRQSGEAYIPKNGENLPGVVLVHGGGWDSRDFSDNRSIGESLASHGYTVISINYRFPPKHLHPAPIDDLATALTYFRTNAKKFKLDPSRIGLWGYSAGGHITALYALLKVGTPEEVQAVVSGGTPYDLTWYPESPIISPYIGGKRNKKLNEYFEASPSWNVKKSAPPFFLYHAKNDKLVEYAQMTSFEAKLRREGNIVESHTVPFWGHAFAFILSDESVEKGVKFLNKHVKGTK